MRIKRFIALLLAALLAALLCGCVQRPGLDNYPYEPDTPAPDPLNGVFVSEGGSMRFNGDGSTVVLDLEEDFAARTGLPAGYSEGTYDFIQALPPHPSEERGLRDRPVPESRGMNAAANNDSEK